MARGIRDEDDDDGQCIVSDEAVITRTTELAVLVDVGRHRLETLTDEEEREGVWIPKSALHDDSEVYDPKEESRGRLIVKGWFARKRGWE